ncbi:MAG: C25 family cysteine peptidase, partial [Bacteroidota bacterium]
RKPADLTRAQETYFLPSFGDPASDNLLTAGLGERTPDLATGRLAAINEREVAIYLKKLRDVEKQINEGEQSLVDREWMKQIMHLGGGGVPYEQRTIRNNLALLENTIEETELGAEVTSFFKTSSEPVEESRQAAIFERINNGTSIITFYGHSSSQGFDFSIDDPNNYFNFGKYPYILSLGCYSGDAFTEARSVSERFLFLEDKGAVAFAASKGLGFIGSLRVWANQLYDLMGNEYYGRGIGEAIRGNIDAFSTNGQGNGLYLGILLEQFSLSGDPAYRLHPRPGPDLVVDAGSVSFTPEVIPAQNDSFRVDFSLVNLGSNSGADSLSLTLEQELPSGERVSLRRIRVARPAFSSLEQISLPSLGLRAVGQNRLHITVDVDDEISEAPAPNAERNNILRNGEQAGVPLVFIANTARGVYPFNYYVIGGEIELISSTSNVLAEERDYVIQVATDKNFADLVEDRRITASGGVIRLQPGFAPVDETTYFWRISPDSTFTEGAGFIWDDNSFTWSAGGSATAAAWSLQHPGQLDDGAFTNILSTPTSERWNFARTANDITIINSVYRSNELPAFLWNGQPFRTQFPWDVTAGIQLTVIDSLNNVDWLDNPGDGTYGAVPGNAPGTGDVFSFDTRTEAGRLALIDFIDNVVEPGKYVTLFSAQRGGDIEYVNADWGQDSVLHGKSIFQVLEAQGANKVRQLADLGSVPYTFVFQKDFGPLAEGIAGGQDESISIVATIGQNWDEGNWASPRIGPVSSLTDAQLDFGPSGISASDDCRLVIYGQPTPRAARTPLLDTELQLQDQLSFTLDLSEVAVADYPYLSATLEFEDSQQLSVPSLLRFRLTATGYGDVAISPTIARELPDSVEQGEEVIFRLGYENVTPVGMDSLLAEFTVVDGNNEERQFRKRLAPLPGNASGSVEFPLVTADLFADFRWQLELNPRQDQPEPVTFNNFTSNRVPLGRDQIAPHMSLFFDGVNILDGDLVSAAPEILIRLKDENNELLLRDTSLLRITLQEPSGNRSRISFADSRIEFLPASEANNVAE